VFLHCGNTKTKTKTNKTNKQTKQNKIIKQEFYKSVKYSFPRKLELDDTSMVL